MISIFGNIQSFKPMIKVSRKSACTKFESYSNFRIRKSKIVRKKDYKCCDLRVFTGKFLGVTKYACVKDLTNIMSGEIIQKINGKAQTSRFSVFTSGLQGLCAENTKKHTGCIKKDVT